MKEYQGFTVIKISASWAAGRYLPCCNTRHGPAGADGMEIWSKHHKWWGCVWVHKVLPPEIPQELRGGCSSSQGTEGQHWALLSVTATGPEGMAWSCVRGGAAGGQGWGLHQRAVGMEWAAQGWSSVGVCTPLSGIGFEFGVFLCGARSWVWWSLWVSSPAILYSAILFCDLLFKLVHLLRVGSGEGNELGSAETVNCKVLVNRGLWTYLWSSEWNRNRWLAGCLQTAEGGGRDVCRKRRLIENRQNNFFAGF